MPVWEDKDRISLFPDLKWSLRECGNSDPYLEEGEGEHQTILPESNLEQQYTEIQSDWFSEWDPSGHSTGVSFIKDGPVLKMDHWYAFVAPSQNCAVRDLILPRQGVLVLLYLIVSTLHSGTNQ